MSQQDTAATVQTYEQSVVVQPFTHTSFSFVCDQGQWSAIVVVRVGTGQEQRSHRFRVLDVMTDMLQVGRTLELLAGFHNLAVQALQVPVVEAVPPPPPPPPPLPPPPLPPSDLPSGG